MDKYGYNGPEQFRPLSPWAYVGYTLLFILPIIGQIALLVFTFSDGNINRRSFARSYWCYLLLAAIVVVCALAVGGVGFLQLMSAH